MMFVVLARNSDGTTPPTMPMVEGGRKKVVCSCRAAIGMGASVVHVDGWEGRESARGNRQQKATMRGTCWRNMVLD
jgi:hypothetical protein